MAINNLSLSTGQARYGNSYEVDGTTYKGVKIKVLSRDKDDEPPYKYEFVFKGSNYTSSFYFKNSQAALSQAKKDINELSKMFGVATDGQPAFKPKV